MNLMALQRQSIYPN